MRRRDIALLALLAPPLVAGPGRALGQGAPAREILAVTGRLAPAHLDNGARFDLRALEALGIEDLATRTPWTGNEIRRFQGVPLARLLAAVGAEGRRLRAVALNDYAITAEIAELIAAGGFLATRQDGQPLRIRDRGPIWLIFPWSARPELDTPTHRERSIWQIRRIEIA
jgi:hypothetical protein